MINFDDNINEELRHAKAGDIVWNDDELNLVCNDITIKLKQAKAGDIVWNDDEYESKNILNTQLNTNINKNFADNKSNNHNYIPPIKIEAEKVEHILNLIGELVVIKSQIVHDKNININKNIKTNDLLILLDKTIRELQEKSLFMRMTSLKSVFLKVQRVISELAERLNKPIMLSIIGEHTEIDRNIVDYLFEPLIHLCRNAIDHGIENTEERILSNKSSKGHISLVAGHQGAKIFIDVIDDGCGLNYNKILQKAKEKGLLSENADINQLSNEILLNFLFLHNFSTASIVSDVSGRGVGLNIVKSTVEQLKGHIEVENVEGKGTKFRLWIPITVAISDAMLVKINNIVYALPVDSINEIICPEDKDISEGVNKVELIKIRDHLVPLIRLKNVFNNILEKFDNIVTDTSSNRPVVIACERANKKFALLVDAIIGQNQIVIKNLNPIMDNIKGIAGAAIMGDGKVGLIINVDDLI